MRRRASEISLTGESERLPLAPARDEIRRLGETLNAMLDRLRRSFERERRFVADASHEFRSPIAVIKTELEGVLRTDGLGPHEREAIAAAAEECDRLAQLAEDQQVLGELGEVVALLERCDQRLARARTEPACPQRGLELGLHHRDRRAQLVAGVGDEVPLALEGPPQPVEHVVERLAQAADLVAAAGSGSRSSTRR